MKKPRLPGAPLQSASEPVGQSRQRPAGTSGPESPPRIHLTGAILAGGRSRRLGQDKAALVLADKPLALWVAERLAPLVSDLWLVTNTPLAHVDLGLPILSDLVPDQGPLGGLRTALFYSRTPWVLAASVDNPFLSLEFLAALAGHAAKTRRAAVVCRSEQGLEPFPGLYHVRLLERLADYLEGRLDVRPFLEKTRPEVLAPEALPVSEIQDRWFFNLNTPEDLRQAEAWMAQIRADQDNHEPAAAVSLGPRGHNKPLTDI